MKWLVDECTGPSVGRWLREQGFDVYSVGEQSPGWSDWQVLAHAVSENRVVISNDKDFGELVFKNHMAHCGIVFMRLDDERIENKITILNRFLANFLEPITPQHFIVLTEKAMRVTLIK
jgi:predicted nuclease of predicted toxin-antitoxin system